MIEKIVNKFTVYDSEEVTALELIESLGNTSNQIIDELNNKTDKNGDHKGSWQGIKRPTMSDEGLRGAVEKIIDEDLPRINEQLETNTNDVNLQKVGGVNVLSFSGKDDTEKFQNALNSAYNELIVPEMTITRPLIIPHNRGKVIRGVGGLKRTAIRVNFNMSYQDRAVLEYLTNEKGEHNYSGLTLENIHLIGNDSKTSGIKLQYVCYPLFNNVLIEGFVGSGLILDKCQDGSFNNLIIQNCGRSTGDGTNNEETTHAPLEFFSTMENDHNNMLRFKDIQIEQNKVSPYIRYTDNGGMGIWFDKCHFEVREEKDFNKFDLFEANGGDIEFNNVNVSPTFRNGFIYNGYGSLKFSNCRSLNNIINKGDGVNNSLSFLNCNVGNLSLLSADGFNNFILSTFEDITFNYASGIYNIKDCKVNAIVLDNKGVNPRIYIDNVKGEHLYYNSTARGLTLKNSHFYKTLKFDGAEGECINNTCNGAMTINKVDNIFKMKIKTIYDNQIPVYGYWSKGSKVYNTDPSSGNYVGWICIESGSPGTWKGFGVIS